MVAIEIPSHIGCLPFVRINRLGRALNNGKSFSKSANQPNEITLTICTSISRNCLRLMRDWKLESLANPPFRSERKKRSTSEGTPKFPNGISGKLPYHLTSNRNFWIFSPNDKHPILPKKIINTPALLGSPPAWFLKSKCELRKLFLNFYLTYIITHTFQDS